MKWPSRPTARWLFSPIWGTTPFPWSTWWARKWSATSTWAASHCRTASISPAERCLAQGSKAIGQYDPAANKIDLVLGTGQDGTHTVVVSKDLNHIFAANMAANSLAVFERTEKPAD